MMDQVSQQRSIDGSLVAREGSHGSEGLVGDPGDGQRFLHLCDGYIPLITAKKIPKDLDCKGLDPALSGGGQGRREGALQASRLPDYPGSPHGGEVR